MRETATDYGKYLDTIFEQILHTVHGVESQSSKTQAWWYNYK